MRETISLRPDATASAVASTVLALLQRPAIDLKAAYAKCLSSMQASENLAGDLETLTSDQAISIGGHLRGQWSEPYSQLYVEAGSPCTDKHAGH